MWDFYQFLEFIRTQSFFSDSKRKFKFLIRSKHQLFWHNDTTWESSHGKNKHPTLGKNNQRKNWRAICSWWSQEHKTIKKLNTENTKNCSGKMLKFVTSTNKTAKKKHAWIKPTKEIKCTMQKQATMSTQNFKKIVRLFSHKPKLENFFHSF